MIAFCYRSVNGDPATDLSCIVGSLEGGYDQLPTSKEQQGDRRANQRVSREAPETSVPFFMDSEQIPLSRMAGEAI